MYEEHDTDARTHATDLNGVGASPTRSSGRVLGFTILSYYHKEIIHPPSSDILHTFYFSPPMLEPRHRFGTTHLRRRPFTSRYCFG
jgi:hypothetical protein